MTKAELAALDAEIYQLKLLRIQQLERELAEREALPHLHRHKHYKWSRQVFESTDKEIFLVAANQLGKSTVAIRKIIHLATEPKLWAKFWPKKKPNLFWYFYPSFQLATTEFETKWMELLPQGDYKSHAQYGWKAVYDKGVIQKIVFNSGIILQFRAYSQKLIDLQAASVYYTVCDEEMPTHLLPEIKSRLNATDGYFMMVFTATLGQLYWKETMEPSTKDTERHAKALKIHASLYDSQFYEDGSPSHWTIEKIEAAKANCPTDAEIQRRVYGRFVKSEGLMFESFNVDKNMSDPHPLPKEWLIYGAVDPGTGGTGSGHPAGILFVGVNPQFTKARVFRAWRGDNISTTSQDILNKFRELRKGLTMTMQIYDYAAKDFYLVASSQGETFVAADKAKDAGVAVLNTLFKSQMLSIQRGDSELDKLVAELSTLGVSKDKRKAQDDLIDPLRYICKMIPWDYSAIEIPVQLRETPVIPKSKSSGQERRDYWDGKGLSQSADDVSSELDYWSDMMGE